MEKFCECNSIDWNSTLYEKDENIQHICRCCTSKKNRGEITQSEYESICVFYKKYYSKGVKHIYPPCSWYE